MNTNGSFGAWLKQRRKALDLTQTDLANQVGCAMTTIQKIEADIRRPSKQIAERLADVLALTPEAHTGFVNFARQIANHSSDSPVNLNNSRSIPNLPVQSAPFLGREIELAQIAERLADPNCHLLTLVGVGGIGKTRLAVQAAANQLEDFTDGVYFVSLTPVGSTTLIAAAIASTLQISFHGQDDPHIQLVNYLRAKHVLLIMDNYEHLRGGVNLLTELLVAAPRLKILATSRERLNLQEEWVLPVEGLPFPVLPTKAEVGNYSAIQLFVQTARRLQPGFLLEANQEGVADICQAVEGMPLGIELAATWLRAMPCQQIAGQIRRDLGFLATPLWNVPDRHRSMRAVFNHSWSLLSEAERNVLMKLSVFRGGIDPDAALEVAQAPLWMLAGLVDKSFARLNAAGRFELHELLRQFAADKLEEIGKTAEAKRHHFQYFLGVAEQLDQWFFGPQHLIGMDGLEIEHDNFRAALDWALQVGEAEYGLRMAGALGWFWDRRTYWGEGSEWLEKFLVVDNLAPLTVRANAIHHLLQLSFARGDMARVAALSQEAIALVPQVYEPRIAAWLLASLGFVEQAQAERKKAYLEKALALFTELGDQWGICESLVRLSGAPRLRGDFEQTEKFLKQSVAFARQAGDKSILSWTLMAYGCFYWFQGIRGTQSERHYQESLMLFRELRYKYGIHIVLGQLGQIAYVRGEIEQAKTLFEESLRLGQQMGNFGIFVFLNLINLAEIFCIRSELDRAACLLGAVYDRMQIQLAVLREYENIFNTDYERVLAAAHAELDEATFANAYAQGQRMSLDEAVAYALMDTPIDVPI